jgi:hydroxymethylbilane synthase
MLGDAEIITITTTGDRGLGGLDKSRWVSELEESLRAGEIDLAVHSAKDLPGVQADGLELLGAPARASPEDVLCGATGLEKLPLGARVATSSLRRSAQLRAVREDLEVLPIAGNVETRIGKLSKEGLHAIVLARAGLERLGREDQVGAVLDLERFVPAPGQGTLALQGRAEDQSARAGAQAITDQLAFTCLLAERALAQALQASCHTPLGAHATTLDGRNLRLRGWVGLPDGSAWISDELEGDVGKPEALGARVGERMSAAGAEDLLRTAQEMAVGQG